jgi:hypothetical protein
MVCEWAAAPVLRNTAEQAMLDLVPLRRARRCRVTPSHLREKPIHLLLSLS